jgi:hypothetical protein
MIKSIFLLLLAVASAQPLAAGYCRGSHINQPPCKMQSMNLRFVPPPAAHLSNAPPQRRLPYHDCRNIDDVLKLVTEHIDNLPPTQSRWPHTSYVACYQKSNAIIMVRGEKLKIHTLEDVVFNCVLDGKDS